jgi:hypothetical protein
MSSVAPNSRAMPSNACHLRGRLSRPIAPRVVQDRGHRQLRLDERGDEGAGAEHDAHRDRGRACDADHGRDGSPCEAEAVAPTRTQAPAAERADASVRASAAVGSCA